MFHQEEYHRLVVFSKVYSARKKSSVNNFSVAAIISSYICSGLVSASRRIKREVRCDSDAIPVAVRPASREWQVGDGAFPFPTSYTPLAKVETAYHCPDLSEREGVQQQVKPEDLPDQSILFQLSGERLENLRV